MLAQTPPAIHHPVPFVDYYYGVKVKKDGTFDHWYRISCKGKCFVIKQTGQSTYIAAKR